MSRWGRIALVLTTVVVVGAAVAVFALRHEHFATFASSAEDPAPTSGPAAASDPAVPSGVGDPSLAPQAGVSKGADPMSGQTLATEAPVTPPGALVPVSVTFYGWNATADEVEVGGYAGGIIESGGTCILTLTKGAATVSAQRPAKADANSTTCGELDISGSRVSAGAWRAVLSYRSATHSGAAAPLQIEVTS